MPDERTTPGSVDPVQHALARLGTGDDPAALDQLLPLVYDELRLLARRLRRSNGTEESLNTTGLVHELYLKLVGAEGLDVNGRVHFFALAARAMRNLLNDHARANRRDKRGGGAAPITLDSAADLLAHSPEPAEALVALDEALTRLATRS